jgi:hypothetical protein
MKIRLPGLFTVLLVSLSAAAQASIEPNGAMEYFGTVDYYFRGNIDKDVINNYDAAVDALGNAGYDFTTTGGIGGRVGLRKPIANDLFDIGASASLVAGPKIDVNFIDSTPTPGTIHETITTRYSRLMAEFGARFRMTERSTFRLGGAAGLGRSASKDSVDGTGAYAGSQTFTHHDDGFAWEITPSIIIAEERAKFEFGVRYAGFPKIKQTMNSAPLDWNAFGIFIGASF